MTVIITLGVLYIAGFGLFLHGLVKAPVLKDRDILRDSVIAE